MEKRSDPGWMSALQKIVLKPRQWHQRRDVEKDLLMVDEKIQQLEMFVSLRRVRPRGAKDKMGSSPCTLSGSSVAQVCSYQQRSCWAGLTEIAH
eukprot:Skav232103  [mRNA]  locus=scaffold2353:114204:114485:+ [translate_table: standard]